MKAIRFVLYLIVLISTLPNLAIAGDGATILFREGQVAYLENGYSALVEEYKKLNSKESSHKIVELKLESNPFLINISEIVIICRDRCKSLEVVDPRRTDKRIKQ